MEGKLGEHHSGELRQESGESKAQRIIREELKGLRWTESELKQRLKSDPGKLAMAARLRKETTVTLKWIALRLVMGSWKSLNSKLHQWRRVNEKPAKTMG